jgi:predicted permease
MAAQATSRAREMALRASIGAGPWRLVQLVLVESAMLALLAGATGGLFAWWSAPFVVSRINPADNPARLSLPLDWRVIAFGLALTLGVTLLFGLAPALRASGVKPASALKGGSDPHSRRRLMHALIAVQVAFCFLVLFAAGLFAATFDRLSKRPMGFSSERLLTLDTVAQRAQSPILWDQVADQLRTVPGVEKVALAGFPLLGGGGWNGFVSVNGAPPGPVLAFFLYVSPGWADAMQIPFVEGRDFRPSDTSPGAAIVNETFARQYFNAEHPLGKLFAKGENRYQVVGVVRDAPYRSVRESIVPVAYVPFHPIDAKGALQPVRSGTFIVRTRSANPLALASTLRREVPRARSEFRVSNVGTQEDLVRAQTLRERLLAMLALFFAAVALLLAGIGLYGVLDYGVLQRRREIGIRMAIGARGSDVLTQFLVESIVMSVAGGVIGLLVGFGGASLLGHLTGWSTATPPIAVAIAVGFSAAVGMFFGYYPARKAAALNPIQALRYE